MLDDLGLGLRRKRVHSNTGPGFSIMISSSSSSSSSSSNVISSSMVIITTGSTFIISIITTIIRTLPNSKGCSGGTTCLTLLVQRGFSSKVAHHAASSISRIRQVMS